MRKFLCFYILTEREMDQIQCELDEYQKYKFLAEIPEAEPHHEENPAIDL